MPKPTKFSQSVPSSISTPESLARDVSDLSGSYIFGSKSLEPSRANWRQGHELDTSLSSVDDSTILTLRMQRRLGTSTKTPVLLILMDSRRNIFEIIRLFTDSEIDSAKNIVDIVQDSIPNRWKPSCDGIFQKRGTTFTQLINILKLRKYDIQPNEILIGKPMYMTSRQTMSAANRVMEHLTDLGFLRVDGDEHSALGMETAPFLFEINIYNKGSRHEMSETQQTSAQIQKVSVENTIKRTKGSDNPLLLDKISEVHHYECRDVPPPKEKILRSNESAISAILSILDCCYLSQNFQTSVDYTYRSKRGREEGYGAPSLGAIGENDRLIDARRR